MTTILEILEKELIGKKSRVCVESKIIYTPKFTWFKKSNNVTNKQFNSLDLKYRYKVEGKINLGYHKTFENHEIIGVNEIFGDDYGVTVMLKTTGGNFRFDDSLMLVE